jgi:hypothetical protein
MQLAGLELTVLNIQQELALIQIHSLILMLLIKHQGFLTLLYMLTNHHRKRIICQEESSLLNRRHEELRALFLSRQLLLRILLRSTRQTKTIHMLLNPLPH